MIYYCEIALICEQAIYTVSYLVSVRSEIYTLLVVLRCLSR